MCPHMGRRPPLGTLRERWAGLLFLVAGCQSEPSAPLGGLAAAGAQRTVTAGQAAAGLAEASGSGGSTATAGASAAGTGAGQAAASAGAAGPEATAGSSAVDATTRDPVADSGPAGEADAGSPTAQPVSCPPSALTPGVHEGRVEADGRERSYVLLVPSGYTGTEPVPVVVDFHGYGSSGRGQMGASGFRELAQEKGFLAVYPDGVGGSWHVNGCCGQAAQAGIDEIAAVRALVADVGTRVCVDPDRIYASGISQGGGMAHHVACLAADLFAAVAPVSSDIRTEPCEPVRPLSEISFRGTADRLSPFEGGPVGPPGMQYEAIGARPTLERWAQINGCTGPPQPSLELCEGYTACEGGVEVTLCTLPGGGHVLYDNPSDFDIAAAAWAMFERQTQ